MTAKGHILDHDESNTSLVVINSSVYAVQGSNLAYIDTYIECEINNPSFQLLGYKKN